jgi:hypothetical protein
MLPTIAIKTQWDPGREVWIAYSVNSTVIRVEAKTKPEVEQMTLEALNEYAASLQQDEEADVV